MRLLYTLRYGSASGNCGGDLRLFFTTQNSSDWKPTPAPGMWLLPANTADKLTLSSGDSISFALYPVNNGIPGELYLFGAITVATSGRQVLAPHAHWPGHGADRAAPSGSHHLERPQSGQRKRNYMGRRLRSRRPLGWNLRRLQRAVVGHLALVEHFRKTVVCGDSLGASFPLRKAMRAIVGRSVRIPKML
jgi:hypothetical protein